MPHTPDDREPESSLLDRLLARQSALEHRVAALEEEVRALRAELVRSELERFERIEE